MFFIMERPFHVLAWRRHGNFVIDADGTEITVSITETFLPCPYSVYTYWEHGEYSICWVIVGTWKVGIRNGEFRHLVYTRDDICEFETLVIQYVSPFLIKDLCVLVASFM